MKRISKVFVIMTISIFSAGVAMGVVEISAERGKALFNDPKLGTSGKSCATCHVNGKGLDKAGGKNELGETINACVTGPLRGKALDIKSSEMKSLMLYIQGLKKAK